MARNFKHRYFLCNGTAKEAEGLNILSENNVKRDIVDISEIDLFTFGIKESEAEDTIRKFNSRANLDGEFFIASYPHANYSADTFPAIFDTETVHSGMYLPDLEYFARQRNNQVKNGEKLLVVNNDRFTNYVYKLLLDLYKRGDKRLLSKDSLIAYKLKQIIDERDKRKGDRANIDSKIYILKSILSNYKQLRMVTYEHLLSCEGENPIINGKLHSYKGANYKGLEKLDPVKYDPNSKVNEPEVQMTLADFLNVPRNNPTTCKGQMSLLDFVDDQNLVLDMYYASDKNAQKDLDRKIKAYKDIRCK